MEGNEMKGPIVSVDVSKGESHYQGFKELNVKSSNVRKIKHDKQGLNDLLKLVKEMAQSLKRLWKVAINQAEFPEKERTKMKTEDGKVITVEIEEIVFDGTGWEYFFKGKRANFQGGNKGGKGCFQA